MFAFSPLCIWYSNACNACSSLLQSAFISACLYNFALALYTGPVHRDDTVNRPWTSFTACLVRRFYADRFSGYFRVCHCYGHRSVGRHSTRVNWLGEVQKVCGDLSHALNKSDIYVAADQQSVVRRVSQRAHSTLQAVIDQVQIVREAALRR